MFDDTGALMVSVGLERERLERAMRLINREIKRLKVSLVGSRELTRARDYAIGQLRLGLEGTTSQMMWVGEHFIAHGRLITPEESMAALSAVTAGDIRSLAQEIMKTDRLSVAMILPDVTPRLENDLVRIMAGIEGS